MARETDEQIDRLLRQVFKPGSGTAPVDDCPDAEVLAAWADGRLTGAMQSAAVSHFSTCGRCQAIVAELSKMGPLTEKSEAWWRRGLRVRWLVPMTAAAAAVVIWLVVPSAPSAPGTVPAAPVPPASPTEAASAAESPADRERAQAAASDRRLESPSAAPVARDERADFAADRAAPMKAEADAAIGGVAAAKKETPEARTAAPRQATAPASPARAAAASVNESTALSEQKAVASFTVSSPDRSVAWRIGADGAIVRSSDGGSTWDSVGEGLAADLLAGASSSPNVCWLVGRSGLVLLTIDGRRFTRLPFPENLDLAAVQATDGRIAQVTASGGRIFRTADGGQTWTEARPQDF